MIKFLFIPLLALSQFSLPARPMESPSPARRIRLLNALEQTIHRRLEPEERWDLTRYLNGHDGWPILERLRQQNHIHTVVLLCALADFDFFVGASLSGCVDPGLTPYYLVAASTGIAVGVTASIFVLVYRSNIDADVVGTYYGGKGSGSFGLVGAAFGYYFQKQGRKASNAYDRLYWLGYNSGASVDISAAVLHVGRM